MRIVRAIDIAMKNEGESGERGGLANYTRGNVLSGTALFFLPPSK